MGRSHVVRFLIETDPSADHLDMKDTRGRTALACAAEGVNRECAVLLCEAGAAQAPQILRQIEENIKELLRQIEEKRKEHQRQIEEKRKADERRRQEAKRKAGEYYVVISCPTPSE